MSPTEPDAELAGRILEFLSDFSGGDVELEGASIVRRPDAIVRDPRVCEALGPVELNDASQGLAARLWRARATDSAVFIQGQLPGGGWGPEVEWFTYDGAPIIELALSFQVNGDPVFAAERAGPRIWIYFFDPDVGANQFVDRVAGRTPRACYDYPLVPPLGDTLVFYVHDGSGELRVLLQADRYQTPETVFALPAPSSRSYVEAVGITRDHRVMVALLRRTPSEGTYVVQFWFSPRYPWPAVPETATGTAAPSSVSLEAIVVHGSALEEATGTARPAAVMIEEPIVEGDAGTELATGTAEPSMVQLAPAVIEVGVVDRDEATGEAEPSMVTLEAIVIHADIGTDEATGEAEPSMVELTDDF